MASNVVVPVYKDGVLLSGGMLQNGRITSLQTLWPLHRMQIRLRTLLGRTMRPRSKYGQ